MEMNRTISRKLLKISNMHMKERRYFLIVHSINLEAGNEARPEKG